MIISEYGHCQRDIGRVKTTREFERDPIHRGWDLRHNVNQKVVKSLHHLQTRTWLTGPEDVLAGFGVADGEAVRIERRRRTLGELKDIGEHGVTAVAMRHDPTSMPPRATR